MSKKRKKPREKCNYDSHIENEPEQNKEPKYRLKLAYILDPKEVAELIAASQVPYSDPPAEVKHQDYATYSIEDVLDLINGTCKRKRKKSRDPETKS